MHGMLAFEQEHRYVILYSYLYSASHRRIFRGALSVTGRWQEKFSNYEETQVISPISSYSGVQEESHSRVQDSPEQGSGSWIEQYGTKPQEDHNDQQGAADKWR